MIPAFVRKAELDQIEHLMQITPVVAVGASFGAFFIWMNFASAQATFALHAWLGAFVLIAGARMAISVSFLLRRPPIERHPVWLAWACSGSVAQALCWLVFTLLAPASGGAAAETVLHVVVAATAMGATMHLASFYPVLVAYVLIAMLPIAARDLLIGGAEHLTLAGLDLLIVIYTLLSSGGHARALVQMLVQRRQNASLIEALKRENTAANEARERAEQANASKLRLFAAVNHDLRQPLHAASLLAGTLTNARSLAEVKPIAERIVSCVDSLGNLVDAMLELSRLDSGTVQPRIHRFDLDRLIDEVINANEPQAGAKGLVIRADKAHAVVQSDRNMVLRVLSNLVGNAVRYTQAGSIEVRVEARGRFVKLGVHDTGRGIAPQDLSRIFEAFYQVSNPARDRQFGLGLGLATSRRISDALGLELAARSEPGVGSVFTFVLPISDGVAPEMPMPHAPMAGDAGPVRRVLVVEDDTDSREALVLTLSRFEANLDLCAAASAEHALALVREGFSPDVVVTDQRLGPGMNGMDLVQAVREWLDRAVPAIVVSGDFPQNAVQASDQGTTILLRKPIQGAQLRSILEGAFSTARPDPVEVD